MKRFDLKVKWKKARHAFKDIGSDADKDWKILLIAGIILLLIMGVYSAKVFLDVRAGERVRDTDNAKPTELIDAKALEKVLVQYDKRAEAFAQTEAQTFSFVDPSK